MAKGLNKKILCFVDEYGTAGSGDLYFGAAIVFAQHAGRVDKIFSDMLPANANEIHATELADSYIQGLLESLQNSAANDQITLVNRKGGAVGGDPELFYAKALVETVKVGLKRFRKNVMKSDKINNVDVIMDINHHNNTVKFDAEIERSKKEEGVFKGVNNVSKIDSAASRLLQVADIAAHSRKWFIHDGMTAKVLHERYGVETI